MRILSLRVIALSLTLLPVSGFLSTGAALAHILLGQASEQSASHTTCTAAVSHKILNDVPMDLYEKKKKVVCINVLAPSSETDGEIKDALITVETTAKPEAIEKHYLDWFSKKGWTVTPDKTNKAWSPEKFPYKFFEAIDKDSHKWVLAIGQNQEKAAREYQFQYRKSSELETVKNTQTLDDAAVGDGGEQTYTFACYKKLLGDGETRWDDFVSLTKEGTPAGRVYGAVLLYKTNQTKAKPILETLLLDNSNFENYCGCIITTQTVKEKVAELLKSGDIFAWD